MAEPTPIDPDPGAPIGRDAVNPDLVKLARKRPHVGLITAAGLVFLSIFFLIRLGPDRRFAGASEAPRPAELADVIAGKLELDQLISVTAEPILAHAIRATRSHGILGLRLVPVRGTADQLWLALPGDGWGEPAPQRHTGRLRRLDDLAFAAATRAYAASHPRPAFATAAAIRAGLATGQVTTVTGDRVTPTDADPVELDVVDPDAATIVATLRDGLADAAAWQRALTAAGITAPAPEPLDPALGALGRAPEQLRFTIAAPVDTVTRQLEHARLWSARVEPVTRHHRTTWATLRRSPPSGLDVGGKVLPDTQLDLVALQLTRAIPAGAYVIVASEHPASYWYVPPIAVSLVVIGLVFAWALIRAIRRDLLPAR